MSRSAVTPPKGRATRPRNDNTRRRSALGATLQWLLVVLIALVVLGAIFYFGRDVRSDLNGIAPSHPPAGVVSVASSDHT